MSTDPSTKEDRPALKEEIAEIEQWAEKARGIVAAKRDAGSITPIAYCIANQKGGVGKTTTTINVGACFAQLGLRVAIWDLDPQHNATLGLKLKATTRGTYFIFADDEADPRELLQETAVENLLVIPGHQRMKLLSPGVSGMPKGNKIIADAAPKLHGVVDVNLFDTPGNLEIFTRNGLDAADRVIVPFTPGSFELLGIKQLNDYIEEISDERSDYPAQHGGKKFGVDHVVFTAYDGRENMSKDAAASVARRFPNAYIDPPVPRRTTVATAQSAGAPITTWEPHNAAAIGFMKVTRTIVQRDKILA
jgi:chromosome partitioning protein